MQNDIVRRKYEMIEEKLTFFCFGASVLRCIGLTEIPADTYPNSELTKLKHSTTYQHITNLFHIKLSQNK